VYVLKKKGHQCLYTWCKRVDLRPTECQITNILPCDNTTQQAQSFLLLTIIVTFDNALNTNCGPDTASGNYHAATTLLCPFTVTPAASKPSRAACFAFSKPSAPSASLKEPNSRGALVCTIVDLEYDEWSCSLVSCSLIQKYVIFKPSASLTVGSQPSCFSIRALSEFLPRTPSGPGICLQIKKILNFEVCNYLAYIYYSFEVCQAWHKMKLYYHHGS